MANFFPLPRRLFWIAAIALAVSYTSVAQTAANVKIRRATAGQEKDKSWTIAVNFDSNMDGDNATEIAAAETSSNYKLININSGQTIPISRATANRSSNMPTVYKVLLSVPPETALTPGLNDRDLFHLYAFNLTFDNSSPLNPLQSPVFVPKAEPPPADDPPPGPKWRLKTSTDRESSDLFGSYSLTKTRHKATTGTGDLKVALPFSKNFWNRRHVFAPVIDIKASSDHEADADSLKFAFEWFVRVKNWDTKFIFPTIALKNSGKIEAPKDFDNINAVWEDRWIFPSAFGDFPLFINPFVGFELGKNLRSPVPEAEGKGIFRPLVGANLTLQIPIKNFQALKGFEFQSSYIRRWPMKREGSIDKDDDGNLVGITLNKGPKDYSDSKFIIKINDFFGPYIGYEWGRLPPNFELVDHKWTFGILFKSKVKTDTP
jgi:hypothetical protein